MAEILEKDLYDPETRRHPQSFDFESTSQWGFGLFRGDLFGDNASGARAMITEVIASPAWVKRRSSIGFLVQPPNRQPVSRC
jgi:hypothetical protein